MKKINVLLCAFLLIFCACDDQEQVYDQPKENPMIPVLTIEGSSSIAIMQGTTGEIEEMYASVLIWTRANYGKDITASYTLEMAEIETFDGNVTSTNMGDNVYLYSITNKQLGDWAKELYGGNEEINLEDNPVTIYFRVIAKPASEGMSINNAEVVSNVVSINVYWYEEPWDPIEVTIGFKPVSGDWGEYAVYAHGANEVYGSWPGKVLEPNKDGWYSFVVPTDRPINLIINNNGNGKQFDFLSDPKVDECFEFEIGENNNDCVWTAKDCPDLSIYPSTMYMIGNEFGGWNWESDGIAELAPVYGFDGHFWTVRYISAGEGFKWCAKREWSGDFASLGEDIGFTTSDGNAFVAESGMYMIYMDMPNGKISVEPAKVYGMGDCFGGWDIRTFAFDVEEKTMTYTTTGTAELRIYAASDISPVGNDWWRMEFVVLDGKIAYRGGGGDQERVVVEAGKKITLDFNAGTGTIE